MPAGTSRGAATDSVRRAGTGNIGRAPHPAGATTTSSEGEHEDSATDAVPGLRHRRAESAVSAGGQRPPTGTVVDRT